MTLLWSIDSGGLTLEVIHLDFATSSINETMND